LLTANILHPTSADKRQIHAQLVERYARMSYKSVKGNLEAIVDRKLSLIMVPPPGEYSCYLLMAKNPEKCIRVHK